MITWHTMPLIEFNKLIFVYLFFTSAVFCVQDFISDGSNLDLYNSINENKIYRMGNLKSTSERLCRYRNYPELYTTDLWYYTVSGYCYQYTTPSRQKYIMNITDTYWPNTKIIIPALELGPGQYALFDYKNETFVNDIIAPSFKSRLYVDQWLECAENGMECCETFDDEEYNIYPTDDFPCPALWDGWQCWKSAKSNTTLSQECPIYSFTGGKRICNLSTYRHCFVNGTWNHKTDTVSCAVAPVYKTRYGFHIIVLSISTGLTFPAIVIFLAFSKLRVAKDWETFNLPLYRNLLICIVIKNILVTISKDAVLLESLNINSTDSSTTVLEANGVWCRILAFFENLSKNIIFTCMVLIAYFLHKSIARLFAQSSNFKMHWLYLGVLGVSLIPSLSWAIVKAVLSNEYCWMTDEDGYQWITDGYKYFILVVNLLLLLDILRVLFTGRVKTDKQTLKASAKATLFLLPLFGVPLLLTSQRSLFDPDFCSETYFFVTYTIEASQGVIVAVLFCYLNKKVQYEIKKAYRDFAINIEQRYNIRLWRPMQDPRPTATTNAKNSALVPLNRRR